MMSQSLPDHPNPRPQNSTAQREDHGRFWTGMGRAVGGALLFSISMYMTLEMWWLGFTMERARLVIFMMVTVVLLIGVARYSGFEKSLTWLECVVDAFVGIAVGVVTATLFLLLLGVITPGMAASELIGKVAVMTVPGSLGALLARSQLGGNHNDEDEDEIFRHYGGEIFLMVVGALFVAFTVAPTDEVLMIATQLTPWHAIAIVLVSLAIMHSFVYTVEFRGQEQAPQGMGFWSLVLRFTVVGYTCVILTALYLLWTFGRTDTQAVGVVMTQAVVLGLPGALGAAAARLVL